MKNKFGVVIGSFSLELTAYKKNIAVIKVSI